jgi:hypothetical protein
VKCEKTYWGFVTGANSLLELAFPKSRLAMVVLLRGKNRCLCIDWKRFAELAVRGVSLSKIEEVAS